MSFFLNPFAGDFFGTWIIHDATDDVAFTCPGNRNRSENSITSTVQGTYDLSGNDAEGNDKSLLSLSLSRKHRAWQTITVDLSNDSGVDFTVNTSAVTAHQVADLLNSSNDFAGFFKAVASNDYVVITLLPFPANQDFYVEVMGAETVIKFNGHAPIVEMPTTFQRYSLTPLAGQNPKDKQLLMLLDEDDKNHQAFITGAGLDYTSPKDDWELLAGRSDYFIFTKKVSDTETLRYPAGSTPGQVGIRTVTDEDGNVFVMPHTLTLNDLMSPP